MKAGSDEQRAVTRTLKLALGLFVVWRGALFAFNYVGIRLVPKMGTCRSQWEPFGAGHDFWNGFFRWDAAYYRWIAGAGYTHTGAYDNAVAFYPLYPYLSRWLGKLVGSPFVAGLLISNLSAALGIYFLLRLGELLFDRATGERASVLLLAFPTSFFLSAFYTEGLFFCLAAGSMYYFYRERYVTCGLLGGLSTLTRSSGLVLFVALAIDLGFRLAQRQLRPRWRMLGLLLVPMGLPVFMAMLQYQIADALAFVKVIGHWGRVSSWPWAGIVRAFSMLNPGLPDRYEDAQRVLDGLTALGFLGIGVAMAFRRLPIALWVMVLFGVLMPLSTYNLAGMGRYTLALFPAFLWLGIIGGEHPRLERLMIFVSALFLAVYSLRFMRCGFAG